VSEAIYLRDPEGNGIEVYRDFPRDAWPVQANGRIDIGTDPLDLAEIRSLGQGDDVLPPDTDLGHIHLEVSSISETRAFYAGIIGFDVMMGMPSAIFMAAGGYHHHIGANTWQHRSRSLQGQGLRWFEITLPEEGALEKVKSRIADEDLSVDRIDNGIEVIDPDGIPVRIRHD
jgi:catechol 2,3-dioxygenase